MQVLLILLVLGVCCAIPLLFVVGTGMMENEDDTDTSRW